MPDADRVEVIFPASASDRIRTCNLLLTKQLLCHLSYRSMEVVRRKTLTTNVLFSIRGSHNSAIQIV